MLGSGGSAGSGLGLGSFALVFRRLDVFPELLPPAQLRRADAAAGRHRASSSPSVVVFASLATQLLAERTKPAEILRLE